jgi:triacylglycerol lipase
MPIPAFAFHAKDETYNPQNALTLAEAAQLAYADPDEINKFVCGWGFAPERIQHFHKKILIPPVDTQGYVFSNDEAIIVAFRGTKDKLDWLTDAKFLPVVGPNSIGKVHRGFERALEPVVDELVNIINRFRDNGQMLFYTGHSLGAALATLAARRVQFASNNVHWPMGVYTFGSPCVGDHHFCEAYDKDLQSRTFRFVNNNDAVPRLLMATYRHVGRLLYFDADGRVNSETTALKRFFNLLTTAVEDVRAANFRIDGLNDHGMANYVAHLKANLDKDLL